MPRWIESIGNITFLFFQTIYWLFKGPHKIRNILDQMVRIGVDSLPITLVVALFTGMVFVLQTAYEIGKIGRGLEIYVAGAASLAFVRELGPVFISFVVAARVGSAITAELGSMKITEQIDALRTLATSPVNYLVVPRFLSCTLMLPFLVIFADFIGILGGYFVGVYKIGISPSIYIEKTLQFMASEDILTGLIKAFFFGIIISLISCYNGFIARGGAEGVGRATTISVVTSITLILISDFFLTQIIIYLS
jgi:phospholipid/cholesterol/gamma-HCH transport system permease protein